MKKYNIPKGYKFLGKHVGIKKKKKDFGIIYSEKICSAAGMFTKNHFCGESIPIGKEVLSNHEAQAIVVTSGIANVATGEEGKQNALSIMAKLGSELSILPETIVPSSTGIIGPQLPVDKVLSGCKGVATQLKEESMEDFATAILTTDTCLKIRSYQVGEASVLGIAKGSGMIEPNMATMLVYILTDADIEKEEIQSVLSTAVNQSFNQISVDSDTSTSDTVLLYANGMVENADKQAVCEAINQVSLELAKDVIRDAEGATTLITTKVINAATKEEAQKIGKSIINSPLVKAAIYGNDPNWGRIIMAIGKVESATIEHEKLIIYFGEKIIFKDNHEITENLSSVEAYLATNNEITLTIDLNIGNEENTVYGCDLTEEYVKINSYYTT